MSFWGDGGEKLTIPCVFFQVNLLFLANSLKPSGRFLLIHAQCNQQPGFKPKCGAILQSLFNIKTANFGVCIYIYIYHISEQIFLLLITPMIPINNIRFVMLVYLRERDIYTCVYKSKNVNNEIYVNKYIYIYISIYIYININMCISKYITIYI